MGARGVRAQLCPPPGATVLLGGGGTSPRPREGWRAGAPVARRRGEGGGGRGEGGPRRGSPPPCPGGMARGPRPSPPSSPAHPPWVYTFSRGCGAALGAGRGLVGRRWVSLAGRGGRGLFAAVCSPAFPRRAPRRAASSDPALHVAFPDAAVPLRPTAPAQSCRSAAGTAGVTGRPTGGAWHAAALATAVASLPWVQQPSRGGAGTSPLWPATSRPRAGGGGEWGGGGSGFSCFWFLVGPPEATAKPKGGCRKIAAPNRPQGSLLGPARVGRSGQPLTAQPVPPGGVTSRKNVVLGEEGGLRVGVVEVPFLGGGGRGAAQGAQRCSMRLRMGARWGCAGGSVELRWGVAAVRGAQRAVE